MKKQATIIGLLIIIVLSFSMTITGFAQLSQNRLTKSPSATGNLLEFATAATPNVNVKAAPNPNQSQPMPTSLETIFFAGGNSINPLNQISLPSVNNVISTNDGVSYAQLTTSALWSPRSNHTLTSLPGNLFVMGGSNINGPGPYTEYNDVYFSTDGTNWFQFLANAPWVPRSYHNTIAMKPPRSRAVPSLRIGGVSRSFALNYLGNQRFPNLP